VRCILFFVMALILFLPQEGKSGDKPKVNIREIQANFQKRLDPSMFALEYLPDGVTLVTAAFPATEQSVRISVWDTGNKVERGSFEFPRPTGNQRGQMAISPNGRYVAWAAATLQIWDVQKIEKVAILRHRGYSVAFSPDGRILIAGDQLVRTVNKIRRWDTETWQELPSLEGGLPGPIMSLAFSPAGTLIAAGGAQIKLWNAVTGKEVIKFKASGSTSSLVFSPDGKFLVSGQGGNPSAHGQIEVWEVVTGAQPITIAGHEGPAPPGWSTYLTSLALSSDGRMLASGCEDWTVKLWDMVTGSEIATLQMTAPVQSVALSAQDVLAIGIQEMNGSGQTATGKMPRTIKLVDVSQYLPSATSAVDTSVLAPMDK
jgi:WD40 repeat protein